MAERTRDQPNSDRGLLLVGHGTRDPAGIAEFLQLAKLTAEALPSVAVEPCFLELAAPTIADGVANLRRRGVRRLEVAPVLLFAAGHAKRDIPKAVAEAMGDAPEISVRQLPHLGCDPRLLQLSAQRYAEAVATQPELPPADTLLILVGRGSQDADATQEMLRFSRLRAEQTPVGEVRTCFIAMARPSVDEVFEMAHASAARRVVVQPHLLFEGELLRELRAKVAAHGQRDPRQQWLMADHLGPSPLVMQAIIASASTPVL